MYKTRLHLILIILLITGSARSELFLSVSPEEIDIGEHMTGEKVNVHILLTNKGNKAVSIKTIKSQCSCIIPKNTVSSIKPGESAKIDIEVEGLGIEGILRKHLWIITEEPDGKVYTIKIHGEFKSATHELYSSSLILDLGRTVQGKKIERSLTVYRRGYVPVGILKVTSTKESLQATIYDGDDDKSVKLKIELQLPVDMQSISEEIVLHGEEPNDFLRIPVVGKLIPPIRVSPTSVFVKDVDYNCRLSVLSKNKGVPQLERYVFDSNELSVKNLETVYDNKTKKLNVNFKVISKLNESDFAKGRMVLFFKGQKVPAEVMFIRPKRLILDN